MKRNLGLALGAVLLVAVGVVVWFYTSTNIDESTADVTAPTLAPSGGTASDPTTSEAPASSGSTDSAPPSEATVYALGEGTTVTFEMDEVLNGSDKHIVATNTEVEGQIRVDPADLSATEVGTIVIGAQTFETDSSNRDRAIRGPILDASSFPEITFVPDSIDGLTGSVEEATPISFTITGDLTIRDVTEPVAFDVTATLVSADLLEGNANATVSRETFGLTIPNVASVANVSDAVELSIEFVAGPA